jgi:hypothetical protein
VIVVGSEVKAGVLFQRKVWRAGFGIDNFGSDLSTCTSAMPTGIGSFAGKILKQKITASSTSYYARRLLEEKRS